VGGDRKGAWKRVLENETRHEQQQQREKNEVALSFLAGGGVWPKCGK